MVEYPESGPPCAILRIELEQKNYPSGIKMAMYLERTKHTALRVKKLTVNKLWQNKVNHG